MLKVFAIVSLMVTLVLLAGCSAASTPVANDSSKVIPVTGLVNGSGENVIRPINPVLVSGISSPLSSGSGENVMPPIDPLLLSAIRSPLSSASGENVVRPVLSSAVLPGAASGSGENVVPPSDTMGYQALHPSNP